MKNSKSKIINEIAQELDSGCDCYYNLKTDEIIAIPNLGNMGFEDDLLDAFSDELKKVKKNKTQFIKIEVLESFESFKIMKGFISQIEDKYLQEELQDILNQKKPFQNFKNRIDHSDYRQKWFDFKISELETIVANKLEQV